MIAEELGLKQITNFSQEMLRKNGVYLLDFESEAFIWIGRSVHKPFISDCYNMAMAAMNNIHCNGCVRMKNVTLNLCC